MTSIICLNIVLMKFVRSLFFNNEVWLGSFRFHSYPKCQMLRILQQNLAQNELPWLTGVREYFLCLGYSWELVTPLVASCGRGKQLSRSALRHFSDPNRGTEHMKLVTAEAQPAALSWRETLLNRIVMKRNRELVFDVAVDWCSNWVFLVMKK